MTAFRQFRQRKALYLVVAMHHEVVFLRFNRKCDIAVVAEEDLLCRVLPHSVPLLRPHQLLKSGYLVGITILVHDGDVIGFPILQCDLVDEGLYTADRGYVMEIKQILHSISPLKYLWAYEFGLPCHL